MDISFDGSHESLRSRAHTQRNRRTWSNNNGTEFVFETAHTSPDMRSERGAGTERRSRRVQAAGGLGGAFGLLHDMLAEKNRRGREEAQRSPRRSYDDLAYGGDEYHDAHARDRGTSKGLIGGLANLFNTQQQRERQQNPPPREQPRAPRDTGRTRGHAGSRSHDAKEQKSSFSNRRHVYADDITDNEDAEEQDYDQDDNDSDDYEPDDDKMPSPPRQPRRAFTSHNIETVQALENAAEHHRQQMKSCRRQIEAASRQPTVNTRILQGLLDQLKTHERAYQVARENLRVATAGSGNERSRRQTPEHGRYFRQHESTDDTNAAFDREFHGGFNIFPQPRRTTFASFDDDGFGPFAGGLPMPLFDQIFNDFGFGRRTTYAGSLFGMPQATFTFTSGQSNAPPRTYTSTGPQFRSPFAFNNTPAAPPTPPSTLLKPEEAKRLFQTYNQRWTELPSTEPGIPYPARGLKAASLIARDSIWAPTIGSTIATWSEETVMKANAQAFFLGVVGLSPQYTETPGTGKLVMGYNRGKATPAQVQELVDVLKREKVRWHSDRLGRRNGGVSTGANEALQRDERARAVFHAVCELMDFAQGA